MENPQAAGTRPNVVFAEGALIVDGMRIPLPERPKHEVAGCVYDVLTVIGVALSVALVVAQIALHLPIKVK